MLPMKEEEEKKANCIEIEYFSKRTAASWSVLPTHKNAHFSKALTPIIHYSVHHKTLINDAILEETNVLIVAGTPLCLTFALTRAAVPLFIKGKEEVEMVLSYGKGSQFGFGR